MSARLDAMDLYRCPDGCKHRDGTPVESYRGPDEQHDDFGPTCWKCGAYMRLRRPGKLAGVSNQGGES